MHDLGALVAHRLDDQPHLLDAERGVDLYARVTHRLLLLRRVLQCSSNGGFQVFMDDVQKISRDTTTTKLQETFSTPERMN